MRRARFYIDGRDPFAKVSIFFMGMAAFLRILYFAPREMSPLVFWVHLVNVILAAVLFSVAVIVFGRRLPQLTVIPVMMGVAFFAIKALDFESRLHTVLCLFLYAGVLVLYSLTVFGVIRTKYFLYPLFGLPLLYHIFVEDMQLYVFADPAVPFAEWLPEISVLCIMAALLCISVAMKKETKRK